jgi:hypothetical protein
MHTEIQGGEADLIEASHAALDARVAYLPLWTHSREIEGRIISRMSLQDPDRVERRVLVEERRGACGSCGVRRGAVSLQSAHDSARVNHLEPVP